MREIVRVVELCCDLWVFGVHSTELIKGAARVCAIRKLKDEFCCVSWRMSAREDEKSRAAYI